ncbi:hypothetical protein A0H81_03379 [Grifola frondosa]|uniref:Uncharacterized protein n=1 Tax=Grifola frondosa TaxID=5627 RepID=A0A1C7MGW1_GRIFR|nr:hypothetical protein A0H81_03379 [Grifola frondosa]
MAKIAEEVIQFLHNPNGVPFLFPGNHMRPDLMFQLRDEETGELMWVIVQAKWTKEVVDWWMPSSPEVWSALR